MLLLATKEKISEEFNWIPRGSRSHIAKPFSDVAMAEVEVYMEEIFDSSVDTTACRAV